VIAHAKPAPPSSLACVCSFLNAARCAADNLPIIDPAYLRLDLGAGFTLSASMKHRETQSLKAMTILSNGTRRSFRWRGAPTRDRFYAHYENRLPYRATGRLTILN